MQQAIREVEKILEVTGDSFKGICLAVEGATTKELLKNELRRFSSILRMVLEAAPLPKHNVLGRGALQSLGVSKRLYVTIRATSLVRDALKAYKTGVVQELELRLRHQRVREQQDDELIDELF